MKPKKPPGRYMRSPKTNIKELKCYTEQTRIRLNIIRKDVDKFYELKLPKQHE